MGSTGRGSSTTTQQQTSQTNPWAPAVGPLQQLISQIGGQVGNYQPTANENTAIDMLRNNAAATPNYAPQAASLTNDLFSGGPDRTGYATNAYSDYKQQAQPYTSQDYLNPYNNPAFKQYIDSVTTDATNSANGTAAAMGRDGSGYAAQNLARGIAQGTAPVFANQYNQNVATQRGVMDNLYSAGNQTGSALSLLDQTALNNRMQGANAATSLLPQLQDMQANRMLSAEGTMRGLPLQNLGALSSLLTPLAGLGGTSSGTSTGSTSYQLPLAQTASLWGSALGNLWPKSPIKI